LVCGFNVPFASVNGFVQFCILLLYEALLTYLTNLGRNLMSNKFLSNLAVIAVGATLGSLALQAAPAQAANFKTFNFSFTSGSNLVPAAANKPGSGTFTFDQDLIDLTAAAPGFQNVAVQNATLSFLGQTFTAA
jgi:hypothetical protein